MFHRVMLHQYVYLVATLLALLFLLAAAGFAWLLNG